MQKSIHCFLAAFLGLASLCGMAETLTPKPADVRMVIDISGSMKKTDPTNLRQPAVDLLVRLLPDESKAGLWTFGQSVNMLVPHRVVDPQWRAEGAGKASTINSVALFTNIGGALEAATQDYANPSPNYTRNVILLTDGVVDISKEAVVNLNERKRILTELLPRLKNSDLRIHTIALSNDADQELMKKLSIATDGIFEVAETADELMSTFLRIFDQTVPLERVPLDDNGFLVDSSIQEFTALIFRRADVPASIIIAPDGKEYSTTDPANRVNWYRTDTYDLITVNQPMAGQWKVKTKMGAGSRVTVVSNLQLVVQPLNSNIKTDQTLDLRYSFIANNETVTNTDFLNLLSGEAFIAPADSQEGRTQALSKPARADGHFADVLTGFNQAGSYDIKILIDGKTFKREFVHRVKVAESAFRWEKHLDTTGDRPIYRYELTADAEIVDTAQTQVTAKVERGTAQPVIQPLTASKDARWTFSVTPDEAGDYVVTLQAEGVQLDGSPFSETLSVDAFSYPDEEEVVPPAEEPEGADTPAPAERDPMVNLWIYLAIGLANVAVLVLGYFAYRVIAGKDSRAELEEMQKTLETSVESLTKEQVAKPQVVIDIAEEQTADIPLSGEDTMDMSMPDDLMADNLFPLDNLEDGGNNDDSNSDNNKT